VEERFGIYTRVSDVGGREGDSYGSSETQEAVCRQWAERSSIAVPADAVELDEDVSGSVAHEERALEKLLARCEARDLNGIVVRHLDRFGRDTISGAIALKRLNDCGARLVAVEDGFDSTAPGSRMLFNMKMAVAEDYLERTRQNFKAARTRASKRGVYFAARAPFGFDRWDEVFPEYGTRGQLLKDGRLVVNEREADLVREIYVRRADGQNIGQITRWLVAQGIDITKSGARSILKNRAYLGEAKDADGAVKKNAHTAIIDPALWERANAVRGEYHPRDGSIAEKLTLSGLVICDGCGKRARGGAYGRNGKRTPMYVCTNPRCEARAGMKAEKLQEHVGATVQEALLNRDPYLGAVLEGDSSYVEAEQAVAQARHNLEMYRDNIEIQEQFADDLPGYVEGLRVRKDAYALAQDALRKTPRPGFGDPDEKLTVENADRAFYRRFIEEIRLRPAAEGEERRVEIRFRGQPSVKLAEAACSRGSAHPI